MTTFVFNPKINDPFASITEAALGSAASQGWGQNDVGKAMKLGVANNFVPCADGNDIEGVLVSVEPHTVNEGYGFGTIQRDRRMKAVLAVGATGVAVGDFLVAAAQAAIGTANTGGLPQVKEGAGAVYKWRVLRFVNAGATGVAGDIVVMERV